MAYKENDRQNRQGSASVGAFSSHAKPTCPHCGSDRVQTFPHIQTDDGKTVCKCLACGKPWAEELS